jgi:hypothetical protein
VHKIIIVGTVEKVIPEESCGAAPELYCPTCARPVADPLVCGDCQALICRVCGTPLERIDELGIG